MWLNHRLDPHWTVFVISKEINKSAAVIELLKHCFTAKSIWSESRYAIFLFKHRSISVTIGGSKGGRQGRAAPGVQILSLSCSFRPKNWKIIALLGVGQLPRENPGSATGYCSIKMKKCAKLHLYRQVKLHFLPVNWTIENHCFFVLGVLTILLNYTLFSSCFHAF